MPEKLGERARITKMQILSQGLMIMQEKGFNATTIHDICDAAEVSVGTFYAYFKNKGELFRYSFQKRDDSFADFLDESIVEGNTLDKLTSFIKYYAWLNISTEKEELERIFLKPSEHWFTDSKGLYNILYKILMDGQNAGEIKKDIPPEKLVSIFRIFLRGCIYEWIMGGYVYDLEEYMDENAGILLSEFICV